MAENTTNRNKTVPTDGVVAAFIAAIPDPNRRADAQLLTDRMAEVTGEPPTMWGAAIIGFGSAHYRYASGRQGEAPRVSFAARKAQSVLYVRGGFDAYDDLLPRLGDHSIGKGCLYLKKVAAADPEVLRAIIDRSYRWTDLQ